MEYKAVTVVVNNTLSDEWSGRYVCRRIGRVFPADRYINFQHYIIVCSGLQLHTDSSIGIISNWLLRTLYTLTSIFIWKIIVVRGGGGVHIMIYCCFPIIIQCRLVSPREKNKFGPSMVFCFHLHMYSQKAIYRYSHIGKAKKMCIYGPPTDPNFWPD